MAGSMEFMPKTLRLFRERGVELLNGFVTTPICCPSRSSLLSGTPSTLPLLLAPSFYRCSGMYVHNHNVFTNNDNCTGKDWKAIHEPRAFHTFLHNAGYRTGYAVLAVVGSERRRVGDAMSDTLGNT